MTMLKEHTCLLSAIFLVSLSLITAAQASLNYCNQTCGKNHLPYPFGFSPGCQILLNCNKGEMLLNEFPVLFVGNQTIKINIQPKCNRSLQSLGNLYTKNYAPTSTNAILLNNCSSTVSPCNIPSINVQTHFESLNNCSDNSSNIISCVRHETPTGFFDYHNMTKVSKCRSLLSSISAESFTGSGISLEVQVMKLRWWLQGNCDCSKDATCHEIATLNGTGFRCQCRDGLAGDGYPGGSGCRKGCNVFKYLTGKCGGMTRIVVLIGGIVAGAGFMVCLALFYRCIRRHSTFKGKSLKNFRLAEARGINIPIYPYKQIKKATNSFSENQRLGTGAYGTVYAGKLHNGSWVAIKRIKHVDTDSIDQVMNEIRLISSVSHPNLVRLLGCSIENGEQILVYEFMPNGTLCQHLQRERGDGLAWTVRLSIATETAQAIAHLHSATHPPIYHRDIKSSNILLDYNFSSKVADFGLSRLGRTETSHISTAPQGTPGYLDPQYHQNFHLSDKSDVYSFGVVLVEIITAMKVVDFSRPQNEVNLASFAVDRIRQGRVNEIIDPCLEIHSDAWTLSSVHKLAELAFRCLAFDKDVRPSMTEVATELEQIMHCRWAASEETNCTSSSEVSSCSSSSNICEKPLRFTVKKAELGNRNLSMVKPEAGSVNSMERAKQNSPVSVQDPWLSEQSSPSSGSFLNNVIQ